ncbi:hypothetical protein JXA02_13670, partial [candidate division KSB1 bacterium]|nr:hypothetical protein [candidate division KSB1 bacterium]
RSHFGLAMLILLAGVLGMAYQLRNSLQKRAHGNGKIFWPKELAATFLVVILSGLFMLMKIPGLEWVTRFAYSVFDLGLLFVLIGALVIFYRRILMNALVQSRQVW